MTTFTFTDKICKLLYSANVPTSIVLQDIGIFADTIAIEHVAMHYNKYTLELDNINDTIIQIFDKLRISEIVTALAKLRTIPAVASVQIINHSLNNSDVVAAYAHGYKILFNNSIATITDEFAAALANNMHVTEILSRGIRDSNIQSCVSLTALDDDATQNNKITTIIPFAQSLRKLSVRYWSHSMQVMHQQGRGLHNVDLESCIHLEELDVFNNTRITTYAPFAHSLRKLTLGYNTGITNDGLKLCTNLTELDVSYNSHITTCAPFAKSLCILSAHETDCMGDSGLALCTNIEYLNASGNPAITTCAPFARALRILYANGISICAGNIKPCGICDDGLRLCISIEKLYASDNYRITSCKPFAKTLRVLDASGFSGICDDGLRLCISIKELYASDNDKITTCNSFAKTLKVLHAYNNCGISDKGLEKCVNITKLRAYHNDKITMYSKS